MPVSVFGSTKHTHATIYMSNTHVTLLKVQLVNAKNRHYPKKPIAANWPHKRFFASANTTQAVIGWPSASLML
jgi:hypothetical protein